MVYSNSMEAEFSVGDFVILRSGSPEMVVALVDEAKHVVYATYYNEVSGLCVCDSFYPEILVKISKETT